MMWVRSAGDRFATGTAHRDAVDGYRAGGIHRRQETLTGAYNGSALGLTDR
jgi:hypothetical protein